MITHTSDSHQIPSQNKTKSKLQILKIARNSNFEILKLLDKLCKYEMYPTRTVGASERTRDAGPMDGRTDGQTDKVKPIYPPPPPPPPNNLVVWDIISGTLTQIVSRVLKGPRQPYRKICLVSENWFRILTNQTQIWKTTQSSMNCSQYCVWKCNTVSLQAQW